MFSWKLHLLRYLFRPYLSKSDCTDSKDDYESEPEDDDSDSDLDDLESEVIKKMTQFYEKNPGVRSMPGKKD